MSPLRIVQGARAFARPARGTLVAIGNFDGVHRGHQALGQALVAQAEERALEPVVLTFHPHPSAVLGRAVRPTLTALTRKLELLTRQSAALHVVVEPFTLELAALEPEAFVQQVLVDALGAREVCVGDNFHFGRGRAGGVETLRALGARHGYEVWAQPLLADAQGPLSSSRVRDALASGDVAAATRLLGRPHSVEGLVEHGQGRGRTLGVPTANLGQLTEMLPAHGVYACVVDVLGDAGEPPVRALRTGVVNLGVRPTLEAGFSCEAHLFDWDAPLYGARLRVHLLERLREERRFDGVEALRAQLTLDLEAARAATAEVRPEPRAPGWY